MARSRFGSVADYVVAPGDEVTVGDITGYATLLVPSTVVTFWSAPSEGSQYTDLLDLTSAAIGSVTTDATGAIPQFFGPEGVTLLYADAGGTRRAITPVDLGAGLAANTSAISAIQGTVAALAPVATSGSYTDLTETPALAAVATSGSYTDLTDAPAPGLQYVVKVGGSWPARSASAPDLGRPAVWMGPAPAPSYGGAYALDGDAWWPTP